MPTPIERILAEWSRIATDLTRGGYDDPADALDAAITAERDELRKELRRLLSVVNAVTAPHRHGIPVTRNALDNLANRQIEVESTLNRHLGGE